MFRNPPFTPPRTPRVIQVEHLSSEEQERQRARIRAELAESACPPTYTQRERSGRLACNCPPDDARYDAAECRHAPGEKHTEECVVWCATCSPLGPETVPAEWRDTARDLRMDIARQTYNDPAAGPAALRRAVLIALDEAAALKDERDLATRELRRRGDR